MSTDHRTAVDVRPLEPASGDDAAVVEHLTALVNDVYAVAEHGLWRAGTTRTTSTELAGLIRARQIAIASCDDRIAGSIRVHDVTHDTSEFGMLVAAHEHRSAGVGRALVAFAERRARERRLRAIRLELLVPRNWQHPSKEFLKAWYGRIGYRRVRVERVAAAYPHLAPFLATPCELAIYEKTLHGATP